MIPKVTQAAPNIMPKSWCSECGEHLPREFFGREVEPWNYCPRCGNPIEWDKIEKTVNGPTPSEKQ